MNPSSLFTTGIPISHKSLRLAQKKYWHPLMAPYIMGIRDSTAIFHVHLVKKSILQAFYIIALLLGQNGRLLIINTNPQLLL